MSIWPISIVALAVAALSAKPSDAPRQAAVLQAPSCVPTAPMSIQRVSPQSLEAMPVMKASAVPAMPTTRLVPCYQADSLAGALRR